MSTATRGARAQGHSEGRTRDGVGGANAQQLTWDEQIAARGTFAYALTAKMRDALLVALAVVRSVGPGLVPDDRRAAEGLHANDAVALSRVLFVPEMEIEHHPSAGVSIGALVSAANVGVSDLKALAPTARSKVSAPWCRRQWSWRRARSIWRLRICARMWRLRTRRD
jgi:hypothetical protein